MPVIKEAIEYLFGLGKAAAPSVVTVPAEPPHVYFLRQPDGSLQERTALTPPHNRTALSAAALVQYAIDLHDEGESPGTVWYGPTALVLTYGERHRMTFPLVLSEQYKRLENLKSTAIAHADLVRALRTTFRGTFEDAHPTLLEVLRRVRFAAGAVTTGEVGHGRASLGKEITGEVTGTAAIPEYVKFSIPIFATPCFAHIRLPVNCALEPDAGSGTFRVSHLPGELESALQEAVDSIGEYLNGALPKGHAIYNATP